MPHAESAGVRERGARNTTLNRQEQTEGREGRDSKTKGSLINAQMISDMHSLSIDS